MPVRRPTSTTDDQTTTYLLACNAPRRHIETQPSFDNEDWSRWLDIARLLIGTGAIIVLVGDRGSGKTQIAVELMRAGLFKKPKPLYQHAMGFFLSIRATYADSDTSETQQLAKYTNTTLLVLDEAHERGGSEWEDRMLRHVIDKRYANMADTVIVANKKRDALMSEMGRSVASRIDECGTFIECVGVNWRTPR